jgi:hypothetical protein
LNGEQVKEAQTLLLKEMDDARGALQLAQSVAEGGFARATHVQMLAASIGNVSLLSHAGKFSGNATGMLQLLQQAAKLFSVDPPEAACREGYVSSMAILALHIFFALTDYGRQVPLSGTLLPGGGFKIMCQFLDSHLHFSRQPEAFCEGLILLHYCGYSTRADDLMVTWHKDKAKVIYPAVLAKLSCFKGFHRSASKENRSTSGGGSPLLHYCLLLHYLAVVRKQELPSISLPSPPAPRRCPPFARTAAVRPHTCWRIKRRPLLLLQPLLLLRPVQKLHLATTSLC